MFALPTYVGSAQRVVAMLVVLALVLGSVGYYSHVEAANVLWFEDTLSDSAPSVVANHTIEFRAPTQAIDGVETITITFPTTPDSFTLGSIGEEDIDLLENGVNQPAAGWSVSTTSTSITITMAGESIAATATTTILIGTHATNEGSPNSQITNPATSNTSYELLVSAGPSDSGATRVAIVDTVTVTASVPTIFNFTVSGLATSSAVNGTSTTGSTTPTLVPFGDVVNGVIETLAQRLNVETNARNGFIVTVEQDDNLDSINGADIDGFIDGSYQNTPVAWTGPTPDVDDEDTWGHWGLTSTDDVNAGEFITCAASSTYGCWVAASTTPRQIFEHDGPADNSTNFIGSTTVGYQIEITGLQEAGDDYQAILTYIATPTF